MKNLTVAKNPEAIIALVSYPGQDPDKRRYKSGYENIFEMMPVLEEGDDLLQPKVDISKKVMIFLANKLKKGIVPFIGSHGLIRNSSSWISEVNVEEGGFKRTIIGIQEPEVTGMGLEEDSKLVTKEGVEIVVAHWGNGHSSPVHGHAPGLLHEEVLSGKVRVNTYRMVSDNSVRPIGTTIATEGTFASQFTSTPTSGPKRQALIHNFTAIGQATTLHFVPEHTRDGRDNGFEVCYFDDILLHTRDITKKLQQVDSKTAMYSQKGDVYLVRSENVPEYGDHFIVITGPVVQKKHGMRPQDVAIYAPKAGHILNRYKPRTGVTLLKLNDELKEQFHKFHGIEIKNGEVVFPK